jgi:hypothetical protein
VGTIRKKEGVRVEGKGIRLFYGIGKYILLYSDKAKYTFPPFVSEKKLARCVRGTKRLFGFFEEKGRAATPASFSQLCTPTFKFLTFLPLSLEYLLAKEYSKLKMFRMRKEIFLQSRTCKTEIKYIL